MGYFNLQNIAQIIENSENIALLNTHKIQKAVRNAKKTLTFISDGSGMDKVGFERVRLITYIHTHYPYSEH